MYFAVDPPGRRMFGIISVELPFPCALIIVLPLLSTWTQVIFGVGGPLAPQSRVRSCPSLMVFVEGGEVVNVSVTTEQNRKNVDSNM